MARPEFGRSAIWPSNIKRRRMGGPGGALPAQGSRFSRSRRWPCGSSAMRRRPCRSRPASAPLTQAPSLHVQIAASIFVGPLDCVAVITPTKDVAAREGTAYVTAATTAIMQSKRILITLTPRYEGGLSPVLRRKRVTTESAKGRFNHFKLT